VKHFDALELGLNSTFRIKAGAGITRTHLYNKSFLHAKGEKIREGDFTATLEELLQSQQPWLLAATAAAKTWMPTGLGSLTSDLHCSAPPCKL